MRLDTGSRTRIIIDEVADHDLDGTTIELSVDGTWYPATWDAAATSGREWDPDTGQSVMRWRRTARTDAYFAGPAAPVGPGIVLTAGRHLTETRLTAGTEVLVANTEPLDVKA